MLITGTISKLNNQLNYGFIKVPRLDDIFLSEDTSFTILSFDSLTVGQKVQLEVIDTDRGLFAKSILPEASKPISRPL